MLAVEVDGPCCKTYGMILGLIIGFLAGAAATAGVMWPK